MDTDHRGATIGKRDNLEVIDCMLCGFAHLRELPSREALQHYYANDFWQRTKPGALEQFERQREWWEMVYGDWLELVKRHTTIGTLLDVGCGYGHLLRAAFLRGWQIEGIDPSVAAVKYAQTLTGHAPWCGSWEDWTIDHRYGLVSALWLIEHLPYPLRFLRWAHERLIPGGVLLAVVPNDFSKAQQRANETVGRPYWWIDPTHVNYFTWSSFSNLLGRAGFRIVERQTQAQIEDFLIGGMDYTINDNIGRTVHEWIERADLLMTREERLQHYGGMAGYGLGREIVVIAMRE